MIYISIVLHSDLARSGPSSGDVPQSHVELDIPMEQEDTGKEMYCFICEDGGQLVECTFCRRNFCYRKLSDGNELEHPACVTLPDLMADDDKEDFPCPVCLSTSQARFAPYIINRGTRATLRIKSRTSLIVLIFCIASLEQYATALCMQLEAALGVFEVNLATMCTRFEAGITREEECNLLSQLIPNAPYHLAVVFLTESNPGGGWFAASGKSAFQTEESQLLRKMANDSHILAQGASTVRMFGASCGVNLPGAGVVDSIRSHMKSSRLLSLVLPTAPFLLYSDFLHLFPELFLSLYYLGTDLRSTIYRVWGKSDEVRRHTGLIVFDRRDRESDVACTRLCYAPRTSRPLGVQLPAAWSICGCPDDGVGQDDWRFLKEQQHRKETIFSYRSACCGVQLNVAILPFKLRSIKRNDESFIEEDWQSATRQFPFRDSTMVRMKIERPDRPIVLKDLCLGGPWTIAGRMQAVSR
ncbi:ATPase [Ceratobasidium sp. AG-Ba]|nr:ATPase [Ceratobasidium sp. AG-Ba]QRW11076.1 ATPase [Ceratobasidium sp. AG-Ba]QRW13073.1 ATPase [Ceratobasidium sp. AG-Ba]